MIVFVIFDGNFLFRLRRGTFTSVGFIAFRNLCLELICGGLAAFLQMSAFIIMTRLASIKIHEVFGFLANGWSTGNRDIKVRIVCAFPSVLVICCKDRDRLL